MPSTCTPYCRPTCDSPRHASCAVNLIFKHGTRENNTNISTYITLLCCIRVCVWGRGGGVVISYYWTSEMRIKKHKKMWSMPTYLFANGSRHRDILFLYTIMIWQYLEMRQCNEISIYIYADLPANAKHWYTVCTTSAQRLRRWAGVVQMVYKCFAFTGYINMKLVSIFIIPAMR